MVLLYLSAVFKTFDHFFLLHRLLGFVLKELLYNCYSNNFLIEPFLLIIAVMMLKGPFLALYCSQYTCFLSSRASRIIITVMWMIHSYTFLSNLVTPAFKQFSCLPKWNTMIYVLKLNDDKWSWSLVKHIPPAGFSLRLVRWQKNV